MALAILTISVPVSMPFIRTAFLCVLAVVPSLCHIHLGRTKTLYRIMNYEFRLESYPFN